MRSLIVDGLGMLRQEILKLAKDQFVRYGIRSVSIEDICNDLHISKKTFYTYFSQKEDLVSEVVELVLLDHRYGQRNLKRIDGSGESNVVDFVMEFRRPEIRETQRRNDKFMHDLMKYYPKIYMGFLEKLKKLATTEVNKFLARGIEEGLFRSELAEKEGFVELLRDWMFSANVMASKYNPDSTRLKFIETVVDCLLRMLCTPAGMEYYNNKYLSSK